MRPSSEFMVETAGWLLSGRPDGEIGNRSAIDRHQRDVQRKRRRRRQNVRTRALRELRNVEGLERSSLNRVAAAGTGIDQATGESWEPTAPAPISALTS